MATPRKSKAKKLVVHDDFRSNAAVPPDDFKSVQTRSPLSAKSPSKPTFMPLDTHEAGMIRGENFSKKNRPQEISIDKLSRSVTPTSTYLHTPQTPNLSAASSKQLLKGVNDARPRRTRAKSAERQSHQYLASPARTGSRTPEFFPPSHYAAAAGISFSSIIHKTNVEKFATIDTIKENTLVPPKSSSVSPELASTFTSSLLVSPLPISAAQTVKRRRTFSRSPKLRKDKEENLDALSETRKLVRRASQLGLPDLEKDLLPSLNDTINKMTQSIRQNSLSDSENKANELSSMNSDTSSVTFRNHHMGPLLSPAVISLPTLGMSSSHILPDKLPNDQSSRIKSLLTFQNDSDTFTPSTAQHNLDSIDKKLRPKQSYFEDDTPASENIICTNSSKVGCEDRHGAAQLEILYNADASKPGDPNRSTARHRHRVKPAQDMLGGSISLPSSPIEFRDVRDVGRYRSPAAFDKASHLAKEYFESPHERGEHLKFKTNMTYVTHSKIPQPSPSAKTKRVKSNAIASFPELPNPAPSSNVNAASALHSESDDSHINSRSLNTERHSKSWGISDKKRLLGLTQSSGKDDFILPERVHSRTTNIKDALSSPNGFQVHTGARLSSASPERRRQAIQRLVADLGLDDTQLSSRVENNKDAYVSAQEFQPSADDNLKGASQAQRRRSKIIQKGDDPHKESQLADVKVSSKTAENFRDNQNLSKQKTRSSSKSYKVESSEHARGYPQSDEHVSTLKMSNRHIQLDYDISDSDEVRAQSSKIAIGPNTFVLEKQKDNGQSSFEHDDIIWRNDARVGLERQAQNSKDRSYSYKFNSDDVSFPNSCLPDSQNNRYSITLSADRQRRAFGIPPFESELNISNTVSQSESDTSIYSTSSFITSEGSSTGLSAGAERLFHTLERISTESEGESYKDCKDKYVTKVESTLATVDKVQGNSLPLSYVNQVNASEDGHVKTWQRIISGPVYAGLVEEYGYVEMQRQELIWGLCETELSYVRDLQTSLKVFVHPLLTKDRVWMSGIPTILTKLFDWLDDIYQLHTEICSAFRKMGSSQYPVVLRFAENLLQYVARFEIYQPYLGRVNEVIVFIDRIIKDMDSDFGEFVRIQSGSEACLGRSLGTFLILPIERLTKYQEILKAIWEVTPREHIDHLPTFCLFHSISAIIRVMNEVKIREQEYAIAKSIFSRIKGLPDSTIFISRDRRLLAHGQLEQIIIGRKDTLILDCDSSLSSVRHQSSASDFSSDIACNIPPQRSVSLEISGYKHCQSSSSDLSNSEDSLVSTINKSDTSQDNVQQDRSKKSTRISSVYAFVFTDLVLLMNTNPNGNTSEECDLLSTSWQSMECIGVSRLLSITEHHRQLGFDSFFGLDILPVELDKVNHDIDLTARTDRIFVRPPLGQRSEERAEEIQYTNDVVGPGFRTWTRWRTVLEQCRRHTIRSLTFPPSMYLKGGAKTAPKEESESSVLAILSSGLPMPKSPSQDIGAHKHGSAENARQLEREERGWWAIRYQQVLTELKRTKFSVFDLQPDVNLSIPRERPISLVIRPNNK